MNNNYKENFDAAKYFWINQFIDGFEKISLPRDFYNEYGYKRAEKKFDFNENISNKIISLCNEQDISIFVVIYSILLIFIYKITNINDAVIATPEYKLIDISSNELIFLRSKINSNMTFKDLLLYTKKIVENSYKNQFYKIDNIFKFTSITDTDTLLKIILSYENINKKLNINENYLSKSDLLFNYKRELNKLSYTLIFNKNIFTENTIDVFSECIKNICLQSLFNLDKTIKNIKLIDNDVECKLLDYNKNNKYIFPDDKSIIELFEDNVKNNPNKIAVSIPKNITADQFENYTYYDLSLIINELCYLLKQKEVKSNDIVGIYSDYSINMIIGIFAVLKAGAVYLPLDANYPVERINYFINDSKIKIAIIEDTIPEDIKFNCDLIKISELNKINDNFKCHCKRHEQNDLVYLIYTSGSTGKPKGVMIKNSSLLNFINWRIKEYDYTDKDITLQLVSFSFDGFGTNLYSSLLSGGTLVLPLKEYKNNFIHLKNIINNCKITNLSVVPTIYKSILEVSDKNELKSLRLVVLAGEKSDILTIQSSKKNNNNILLINEFGPTENTITTTFNKGMNETNLNVIGKPINNVEIFILNNDLNLLPIGIAGELYISGKGLAKGYLNNENNINFINSPFNKNEKLFKTGDIVKLNNEGNLEFLGRIDNQIKIRGNRIELEEINNILFSYDKLKEYYLLTKENIHNEIKLFLYIVPKNNELIENNVRTYLNKFLPNYMIPSNIIFLDRLPRNNNDKIDKDAFKSIKINSDKVNVLPENKIEKLLVDIFKECTELDSISVLDDFINIGCNSLHIMKILTKIFNYNFDISFQDFYTYRTIRELSNKILKKQIKENEIIKINNLYFEQKNKIIFKNRDFKNVLITGATGFLGIHLVKDLLEKNINIYCFVREDNLKKAKQKFINISNYYFPENSFEELLDKKIFIICGDLSFNKFGLSDEEYDFFGNKIDSIIHSAALVKHYGDYKDFEKNNVITTKNLIDFALEFNLVLNYISTISISGNYISNDKYNKYIFDENSFYIGQNYLENVYIKSKFEAENLIYSSNKNGLKFNIFRLGNITARYLDGKNQININENAFYNKLKTLFRLGYISKDLITEQIEFSPVDFCSKAIIILLFNKSLFGIFHIYNHNFIKLNEIIKIFSSFDKKINIIDNIEFSDKIKNILNDKNKQELLINVIADLNNQTENKVINDSIITQGYLEKSNFSWPIINNEYIKKIFLSN